MSSLDPEYFEFDCKPLSPSADLPVIAAPRVRTDVTLPYADQELNKEDLKKLLFEEVMSFQSLI